MQWVELFLCARALNVAQVLSQIVPGKRRSRAGKPPRPVVTSKCCLTPSSSEPKKTMLPHAVPCLVTLTWSQSHLQQKKYIKRKKIYQLLCIYC